MKWNLVLGSHVRQLFAVTPSMVGNRRAYATRSPFRNGFWAKGTAFLAGKRYHMEMALVDRRLTLRVDGCEVFVPVDLPAPEDRVPVTRPMCFGPTEYWPVSTSCVCTAMCIIPRWGKTPVHGRAVRLTIDQNFVLGDNSPNSEDSRFWPNQGVVPAQNLVGRAFLVHLPNQAVSWEARGRQWRYQLPDWEQIRWLK